MVVGGGGLFPVGDGFVVETLHFEECFPLAFAGGEVVEFEAVVGEVVEFFGGLHAFSFVPPVIVFPGLGEDGEEMGLGGTPDVHDEELIADAASGVIKEWKEAFAI